MDNLFNSFVKKATHIYINNKHKNLSAIIITTKFPINLVLEK